MVFALIVFSSFGLDENFAFFFYFFEKKKYHIHNYLFCVCVLMAAKTVRWSVTQSPHKYWSVEQSGCVWSVSPGWAHGRVLTVVSVFQGNRGGPLRVHLHPGHPVLRHQGSAAIPDRHSWRQAEEQGLMGDLQRLGVVGVTLVPRSQPARALLLPVDPDAHLAVHLEGTPLRRSSDNHHALLVRPGLLLLSGKKKKQNKKLCKLPGSQLVVAEY